MRQTLRNLAPLKEFFYRDKDRSNPGGDLFFSPSDFLQPPIPLVIKRAVDHLTARDAIIDPAYFGYAGAMMLIAISYGHSQIHLRHFLLVFSKDGRGTSKNRSTSIS